MIAPDTELESAEVLAGTVRRHLADAAPVDSIDVTVVEAGTYRTAADLVERLRDPRRAELGDGEAIGREPDEITLGADFLASADAVEPTE